MCGGAGKRESRCTRLGGAFDRPHTSIHCLLAHHGGIVPALRRRGLLALTLTEREEISRGMASGSSIRDIAKRLERSASTVSREVARHGGRPEYRAHEADQRAWDSALRPKRCLLAIHVKLQKMVAVDGDGIDVARATKCRSREDARIQVRLADVVAELTLDARRLNVVAESLRCARGILGP
jgi:hypothetical protein